MTLPPATTFTAERVAIPPGIRCGACNRLHLPERVVLDTVGPLEDGGGVVQLRCPRCGATGQITLDARRAEGLELIEILRGRTSEHAARRA